MNKTGVTVVVPTLNRGRVTADCVKDLLAQDHRPLEILIVDQSDLPSPELQALSDSRPEVVALHCVNFRGLPEARNYGWQHARFEAILFVDDDIRGNPDLVAEHLHALRQKNVGVVGGGIDELRAGKSGERATGVFNRWTATPYRGFDSPEQMDVDHVPGGNFSVWRKVLMHVGGIDERLQVGAALYEETEFCLRVKNAGYRVFFNGRARLTHLAAGSGGCRVRNIPAYVYGLAHNRSVLIARHLRWYHLPTAFAALTRLAFAYAVRYRKPGALVGCFAGLISGLRDAAKAPLCTLHPGAPTARSTVARSAAKEIAAG